MIFVKLENGFIVDRISASICPEGYEFDKTGTSRTGYKRAMWDDGWNPKPLSQLVSENLEEIPPGYKLSDDGLRFIELTEEEKIEKGIITPSEREKIEDGKIVPKTMEELYADGIIGKDAYNAYIVGCRVSEYSNSDKIFWDYQRDEATKDEWIAAVNAIRAKYPKV